MKLRKFAAMTMAVAMLGGTLAGCGSQQHGIQQCRFYPS